jgi:adenine-specific DNA-methyltransferase
MRYIGSKTNLLDDISSVIDPFKSKTQVFCDLFSGTGSVGRHFKKDFQIISNDLLYFSYVIQKATIENQGEPKYLKLKKVIGKDPFLYLIELNVSNYKFQKPTFIHDNYSPTVNCLRQYLTNENALRIDAFRQIIDSWRDQNLINELEYFYLLAGIIESVPFVSNIAGTYGAYLKGWDNRSHKRLDPVKYSVTNNEKQNKSYNQDVNNLIKIIEGDILYLDPPYNGRQYISNYHLLETVARYDNPEIKGVTGIRNDPEASSDYCKKNKVSTAFENLIEESKFKYIVVSYSNEGLMSEEEISEILKKHGNPKKLSVKRIPYRRYKRTSDVIKNKLNELLFTIEK